MESRNQSRKRSRAKEPLITKAKPAECQGEGGITELFECLEEFLRYLYQHLDPSLEALKLGDSFRSRDGGKKLSGNTIGNKIRNLEQGLFKENQLSDGNLSLKRLPIVA